jgi:hypothetical protein
LLLLLRTPQSFVLNYERGQRRIDILELLRIAKALKTDPRAFITLLGGAGVAAEGACAAGGRGCGASAS